MQPELPTEVFRTSARAIRDRIKGFAGSRPASCSTTTATPGGTRRPSGTPCRASWKQIGVAGALTAYYSKRNGGKLTVIDGHLRKQDFDLDWPTLISDVDDA